MIRRFFLTAVSFLSIFSCTRSNSGPNIKRLRIRMMSVFPSIDHTLAGDATSRDAIVTLNDSLLRMDKDNKLLPALAETWEVSPDHRDYTFKLRAGLRWSDGQDIVAQQIVDSVERALVPANGALSANFLFPIENAEDFFKGKIKDFSRVAIKAPDARTIQIKLNRSLPYWIYLAAYPLFIPIRKELIAKFGDKWTQAGNYVSTGTYRLKEWTRQGRMLVEKNPLYWDQAALKGAFEEVEFRTVEEGSTAVTLYQKGEFDILERVPFNQVPMLAKSEPGFMDLPTLFVVGVGMSTTHPLTKDPNVRRALAMAIDRDLMKKFLAKDSTPIHSWVPPELPGAGKNRAIEFNPTEAKRIWAGLKNPPKKLEYLFPSTLKSRVTAEFLQQQWKQNLGVVVDAVPQDWKVFLKSQVSGDFPLFQQGWVADFPDAINFLELFSCAGGQNYPKMCDKEYDALLQRAIVAKSDDERLKLYEAAEKILLQKNAAIIPITRENITYLVNPKITGMAINGTSEFRLADLRLAR